MEQTTSTAVASAADPMQELVAAEIRDFDLLVRTEQRRIYRVLLGMLRDPDAADALTQECFLKAYQHRERFRGECSARTWLLRIAINLARDYLKSRRFQFWRQLVRCAEEQPPMPEPADPAASPERLLLAREALRAIWAAVEQLSPQQRAIFVLRFVEEMSIEEIAETTALRPGTIKAHLFRATSAVRQKIKGREP